MQNKGNSAFGKNNFDRLEAAGLVSGEDTTAATKTRTQERITALTELAGKITKIEDALASLYTLSKASRLKKLTQVLSAVKKLHGSPLPTGAKKYVGNCLNELTSLREGVYATSAQVDKNALQLIAAGKAKTEILALASAAGAKLDKIMAESNEHADLEEFFRKAGEVIKKNAGEATKLEGIKDRAFMIARAPVVPADGSVSVEKLTRLGFKVENMGGYAVMHNQLVIGISPKALMGDKAGSLKSEKTSAAIRAEADRLRKLVQKKTKTKLQLVSDKSYPYMNGAWFWLMNDTDLDTFARAFPGSHIKVTRWGFAF